VLRDLSWEEPLQLTALLLPDVIQAYSIILSSSSDPHATPNHPTQSLLHAVCICQQVTNMRQQPGAGSSTSARHYASNGSALAAASGCAV
jgi:hypothetical protein